MKQMISISVFIFIVLAISFSMNYYVLSRLCGLFMIKKKLTFWVVLFVSTLSFICASVFQSYANNLFSRVIYISAANWYGIIWLLFSTLLGYEVLRLLLRIKPSTAGVVIIIIVSTATIYSMINAQLIRIKRLEIPGSVDRIIVQLSDIHIGSVSGNYLRKIIDITNSLKPDVVLITGDLVDNFNKTTQEAVGLLKEMEAPVFFVTGNHEGYVGAAKVTKALEAANVTVLKSQLTVYDEMQIVGVDDSVKKSDLEQVLQKLDIDEDKYSILMYHRPVELKELSETKVDLMLSGHTHCGQIFPFNYITGLVYKPLSGLHRHNNMYQYITSGSGTWGPRMRLGSRSEVVLVEVRKPKL